VSRLLVERELRRLAPIGLGLAFGLPVAHYALKSFSSLAPVMRTLAEMTHPSIAVLLAASVLGVATVAPDTSGGGVAFFARLPIDKRRLYASKLLAGGVFVLLALAIAFPLSSRIGRTSPMVPLAYGGGVLASVVAHSVTPALLLGPAFALFGLGICLGGVYLFGINPNESALRVLWGSLGLGCAAAALLAFTRGRRHLRTSRPALLGLGALTLLSALTVGGTKVAHALSQPRALATLKVSSAVTHGQRVAFVLSGYSWYGLDERVVVVDRSTGESWAVPVPKVNMPRFSPDGRYLLVRRVGQSEGYLVDLETRSVEALPGFGVSRLAVLQLAWGASGEFRLVGTDGARSLMVFDPRTGQAHQIELGFEVGAVAGTGPSGEVYVASAEGLLVFEDLAQLPRMAPTDTPSWVQSHVNFTQVDASHPKVADALRSRRVFSWPNPGRYSRLQDLSLSPNARFLVCSQPALSVGEGRVQPLHEVVDLSTGRRFELPLHATTSNFRIGFAFNHAEDQLLVEQGAVALRFELPSGRRLEETNIPGGHTPRSSRSPVLGLGNRVVLSTGAVWESGGASGGAPQVPAAWIDDERCVLLHEPFRVFSWPGRDALTDLGAALVAGGGRASLNSAMGGAK
jgi:hypothetical protein